MAKQLIAVVKKLQVRGGQATPAPPVGTALGKYGINLGQFVQQFNEKTKDDLGLRIPVVVRIFNDKSFELQIKSPAVSDLLLKAAQIPKGASEPPREKVGRITRAQLEEIARRKLPDLNVQDIERAKKVVEGTARNMGLEIVD